MADPSSSRASGWFSTSTTSSCRTVAPFASRPEFDPTVLSGLLRRVRAQPDPQRASYLGATRPPADLDAPFNWNATTAGAPGPKPRDQLRSVPAAAGVMLIGCESPGWPDEPAADLAG